MSRNNSHEAVVANVIKNRGVVELLVQHIQNSKQSAPSSSMTEVEDNLSCMNISSFAHKS